MPPLGIHTWVDFTLEITRQLPVVILLTLVFHMRAVQAHSVTQVTADQHSYRSNVCYTHQWSKLKLRLLSYETSCSNILSYWMCLSFIWHFSQCCLTWIRSVNRNTPLTVLDSNCEVFLLYTHFCYLILHYIL